jgi:anion-transporting  ArsA/GET3 family ATPase
VEIHFITGKGGVGKSAVAAAMATAFAESGKRTYLVELCDPSFLVRFLEVPVTSQTGPWPLADNLWLAHWPGLYCLRDYAKYLLKIDSLVSLFFENQVSQALINIAPALKELAILGKVTSGPPRNVGPRLECDCLVVDSFSTGHFKALLEAPRGMAEAVRMGPMAEQSRDILKVLKNPEVCKFWIVSQPEELPVTEALELADSIQNMLGQPVTHILNRTLPLPDFSKIEVKTSFAQQMKKRSIREQLMRDRLRENHKVVSLGQVFDLSATKIIAALKSELQGVLS